MVGHSYGGACYGLIPNHDKVAGLYAFGAGAGWHGWMHHRTDEPPAGYKPHDWEKPYLPNPTGTAMAYRPPGSILHGKPVTPARPDYEPWSPGGR